MAAHPPVRAVQLHSNKFQRHFSLLAISPPYCNIQDIYYKYIYIYIIHTHTDTLLFCDELWEYLANLSRESIQFFHITNPTQLTLPEISLILFSAGSQSDWE